MSGLLDLEDFAADAFEDEFMTTEIDPIFSNNETETDDFVEEEFCTVPIEIFDNFTAEEFANTNTIEWMHSLPPRYNHSSNVMDLIAGTDAQKNDYVRGLFASAISIFVLFFVWGLLLLTFKVMAPACGSNSFRWLGGKPLRLPSPPENSARNDWHYKEDDVEFQEWKAEYKEVRYQHFVFKAIVWFAGLSIIISALLMSVYGVDSLTNTLEAGRESIDIFRTLSSQAQAVVDSAIVQNYDVSKEVYGILEEVNGLCPSIRDPLCDDIANISSCNVSFVGDDFNEIFQTAAAHFAGGEDNEYFRDIVDRMKGAEEVQDAERDIDDSAAHLNWALSVSMVLSLLLAMLCVLILFGVICPEVPKVLQMIRSKVMIPTFTVLVVFAYFFSMVFVTASIATADMCIYNNETDNIDERLTAVLATSETVEEFLGGKENQNLVVDFINFYLHRCAEETLPAEILQQLSYLQVGAPIVEDFGSVLEKSSESLQEICGFGTRQTEDLVSLTDTLQNQLCSLVVILTDVRDFVQCDNWYPLYEKTVYEDLCYDGTKGFAYVATTQFVIVFMAFVILTFRVAFSEIQIGDEFFDEWVDDDRSSYASSYFSGGSEMRAGENNGKSRFFGGLRNKFGFSRSSQPPSQYSYSERSRSEWMEDTRDSRRERQLQQQQRNWQNGNVHHSTTANVTASRSSVSPEKQLSSSPTARNSIYPSRRFRSGENTVASPTRMATATKTTAALRYEEKDIEVEMLPNEATVAKSPDQRSTKKQREESGSPTSIMCGLGSTSLWTKHWNNIDYVDSEDEASDPGNGHDTYNYGDDVSSVGGGNNTTGKEWWT